MRGINNRNKTAVALVAALLAVFASPIFVQASTIIPGPTVSGTWIPAGNPYIISADTEVVHGTSLTIEAGVEVVVGPDVRLTVNGSISAVGTFDQPITIRGVTTDNYWDRIYVKHSFNGQQSKFEHCNVSDGIFGFHLHAYAFSGNVTMQTEVLDCHFSNISNIAVYAQGEGNIVDNYGSTAWAKQNSIIKNCIFKNLIHGCLFHTSGKRFSSTTNYGYANPQLSGNVFSSLTGNAVRFSTESYGLGGVPTVINNVIEDCNGGIVIADNHYDADIINNIFISCSDAVARVSANSQDVLHNCFYGNVNDFVNYPSTYGQIIWSNDNGDPCDLFYNIFMDPQFEAGSFALSASSPCIDAGDPSIVDYYDPILGTTVSDMGAYGGEEPGAGVPPSPPVIVFEPQSQTVFLGQDVTFEVDAIGYDLYYQWYFGGSEMAGETSDTLALTAVDFADAGNYYCSVSNVYDVVDSAIANLRVTEIGLEIAMHAGLHMTNLVVGTTYSVQAVYSLSNTNWVEIDTFTAGADNDLWFDTEPAGASKFYQVLSQP